MRETKPLRSKDITVTSKSDECWIKSDLYCIECGKKDVWQMSSEYSEYYHDCNVICHSCEHEMCCQSKISVNEVKE